MAWVNGKVMVMSFSDISNIGRELGCVGRKTGNIFWTEWFLGIKGIRDSASLPQNRDLSQGFSVVFLYHCFKTAIKDVYYIPYRHRYIHPYFDFSVINKN